MSTIIETDLKEVLTQISGKLDKLIEDANGLRVSVANDINELKVSIANDINELKVSVTNDINELKVSMGKLDEGQNNTTKRLDSIESRLNTLTAVLFTGLLGIIAKLVFVK